MTADQIRARYPDFAVFPPRSFEPQDVPVDEVLLATADFLRAALASRGHSAEVVVELRNRPHCKAAIRTFFGGHRFISMPLTLEGQSA